MPRFQYSLRDLFLAMTLIAVGVAGMAWSSKSHGHGIDDTPRIAIAVALASAGSIGAGIAAPFKRKEIGLAFGVVIFILMGLVG